MGRNAARTPRLLDGDSQIASRPIHILATLNAVPFYSKLGCRKVAIESVRRHDHDIYVERMELD